MLWGCRGLIFLSWQGKKKKKKLRHGVSGVMLWTSLGKWDEACRCSGYVTGQQETWFHLFGCDNGSGIISFHSELIWAVSVLLLRYDLLGRWDSSSWLPFYLPLWDNQVYIQISSDERADVYTVCVCIYIETERGGRATMAALKESECRFKHLNHV